MSLDTTRRNPNSPGFQNEDLDDPSVKGPRPAKVLTEGNRNMERVLEEGSYKYQL